MRDQVDCDHRHTKASLCSQTTHKCCQFTPELQATSDPTEVEFSDHNTKATTHKLLHTKVSITDTHHKVTVTKAGILHKTICCVKSYKHVA